MDRAAAYLRLVRPVNLLITAAGVYLGGALAFSEAVPDAPFLGALVASCVSAMLIAAGGNCINDVFDIEIDAMNRPDRPLPSGLVSPAAARGIWAGSTLGGLLLGAFVSLAHLAMAAVAAALLFAYSARIKRAPFAGNGIIALLVGLAVVYGGWTSSSPAPAYIAAGFAFLTTFSRELVKDVQDLPGDRSAGARTAPIVYGVDTSRAVAASALIITVLLTPIPFLALDYGQLFLFLVLVADLMLLRVIWLLPDSPREASDASAWLKGAMVAGIAALFAA